MSSCAQRWRCLLLIVTDTAGAAWVSGCDCWCMSQQPELTNRTLRMLDNGIHVSCRQVNQVSFV